MQAMNVILAALADSIHVLPVVECGAMMPNAVYRDDFDGSFAMNELAAKRNMLGSGGRR